MSTATVIFKNPISVAVNVLETDGWTTGSMRCGTGARCAVGALRAAYGLFENDLNYMLTKPLSLEQWGSLAEQEPEVDSGNLEFYVWDDESPMGEVVFDLSDYVSPVPEEIKAAYREAAIALADVVAPGWAEDVVESIVLSRARWESYRASQYYTTAEIDRQLAAMPERSAAEVRANTDIGIIEAMVIEYNDNLVSSDEGRQEILAAFRKAAKKYAKAKRKELKNA